MISLTLDSLLKNHPPAPKAARAIICPECGSRGQAGRIEKMATTGAESRLLVEMRLQKYYCIECGLTFEVKADRSPI